MTELIRARKEEGMKKRNRGSFPPVVSVLFLPLSILLIWIAIMVHNFRFARIEDKLTDLRSRIQVLENKVTKGHDQPSEAGVLGKIGVLEASSKEEQR